MRIETPLCILREWRHTDAESLAYNANNINIYNNLRDFFPHPYSIEDAHSWIDSTLKLPEPQTLFAIEVNGNAVGSIGIITKDDVYKKNVEIGYFIGENYWGKGIITEAIKAITRYAFDTFDIVRVFAEFFSSNKGSMRVLEKAGFKYEASFKKNIFKNGLIQDSCIYSILKEDFRY